MTDIPRVTCGSCQVPLRPEKNGETVEMTSNGRLYYIISADRWKCPICGHEVLTGFPLKPLALSYQDGYNDERKGVTTSVEMEPTYGRNVKQNTKTPESGDEKTSP